MTTFFYWALEILATVVEGYVGIWTIGRMTGQKYSGKKHATILTAVVIVYTIIITALNTWQLFSNVTMWVAVLLIFLLSSFISKAKSLRRFCATIITWFFINGLDFLTVYCYIMIADRTLDVRTAIQDFIVAGPRRVMFLLVLKTAQIIIFTACRKLYPKLQLLNDKTCFFLSIIVTASYIVMQLFTNMILSESIFALQIASVFVVIFIILTIIATIFSLSAYARYQNEKRERELISLNNSLMEQNYINMRSSQDTIRRQVHDFKNHIRTISGMLPDGSEAKQYASALLEETYKKAYYCDSGNDIIDSVINCKMADAEADDIDFTYTIMLPSEIKIASTDICAILANQLDNALEACRLINDGTHRFIKCKIWSQEQFLFFKVVNSCADNPFNEKNELLSSKKNENGIHGFGIKSIRETAAKYNGTLSNEYRDGVFTSLVMLIP